jgi:hypothetical protein
MADEPVPKDVTRLLEQIENYEQLKILLTLHADREHVWTARALAQQLNVSPADAANALAALCALSLASADGTGEQEMFRYSARHAEGEDPVGKLARVYKADPLAIVEVMNAHAIERLRTAVIRRFADAFLIGRKKSDG